MMRQYRELKRRYPDYLLLFRLGDFYELFLEDAAAGAPACSQITLTARQTIPMAGMPHHAAEAYIARLVRAGQKVAICEQMEAARSRARSSSGARWCGVVTPGTVTDTAFLDGRRNNFLLALRRGAGRIWASRCVDVSTGGLLGGRGRPPARTPLLEALLLRRPGRGLLLPGAAADDRISWRASARRRAVTLDAASLGLRAAARRDRLRAHFGVTALEGFGVGDLAAGLPAAGAALAYLRETQGDRSATSRASSSSRPGTA